MYRIIPIDKQVASQIRETLRDNYGHKLKEAVLSHRALCRYCLADGDLRETQILFSYSPFYENKTPYAEVGPVFIHAECKQYDSRNGFPQDLKTRNYLTVRGYSNDQLLISGEMCKGEGIEATIERMFQQSRVDYIHINDARSGCFFMKLLKT